MTDRALWRIQTERFLQYAFLVHILFGVAVRLRIHFASAFPTLQPWLWHLVGLAEDAAVGSVAAVLVLLLARSERSAAMGRALFALAVVLNSFIHLIRSEAVIFFGASVRADDFQAGPILTTIRRSMGGQSWFLLISAVLFLALGLALAVAVARRAVRSPVPGPRDFGTLGIFITIAIASIMVMHRFPVVHRRDTARSPLLTLWDVVNELPALAAYNVETGNPPPDLTRVREMARSPRQWISDLYPLSYRTPETTPSPVRRLNVVFFALESLRTQEVGAYGAALGLTPNFDRLAAEAIRVDKMYSAGSYTPTSELSLWYGLYALPGPNLLTHNPEVRITGLPDYLRPAGWGSLLWISSTDETFFKRERFYRPRGFQMYDGNDFTAEDPRVSWGVSDRLLARRAVEVINRLPEPFAAMVLTVNNHHPFELPDDAEPVADGPPLSGSGQFLGLHTPRMLQTIRHGDQALGDFMAMARQQEWFERTLFVITGDHGVALPSLDGRIKTAHQMTDLRHRVPFLFYSPLLPGGRVIQGPASHVDVLPTILEFLGLHSIHAGLGTDLLNEPIDPDAPVFAWSEHERLLTVLTARWIYHCSIPTRPIPPSGALPDEGFFDAQTDPQGRRNLIDQKPAELERFRNLARIYVRIYPWLVRAGRSGVPPN